jgi:uncharacterized membrane protein
MLPVIKLSQANKNLLLAIVACIMLIALRLLLTKTFDFSFIVWNIFLAVLPIYMSHLLQEAKNRFTIFSLLTATILFLPNSIYLITDLLHLKLRLPIPLYVDLTILLLTAWVGILSSVMALKNIEMFLGKQMNKKYVPAFLIIIMLSCGFGFYLGRFLRWNSWDVLGNPTILLQDIFHRIFYPMQHPRTWSSTILFAGVYFIFYKTLSNNIVYEKNINRTT